MSTLILRITFENYINVVFKLKKISEGHLDFFYISKCHCDLEQSTTLALQRNA